MSFLFIGMCHTHSHIEVTNIPAADKHLTPINDIVTTVLYSPGFIPGDIGARVRLGKCPGTYQVALTKGGEILLFLLFSAVIIDNLRTKHRENNVHIYTQTRL